MKAFADGTCIDQNRPVGQRAGTPSRLTFREIFDARVRDEIEMEINIAISIPKREKFHSARAEPADAALMPRDYEYAFRADTRQ